MAINLKRHFLLAQAYTAGFIGTGVMVGLNAPVILQGGLGILGGSLGAALSAYCLIKADDLRVEAVAAFQPKPQ